MISLKAAKTVKRVRKRESGACPRKVSTAQTIYISKLSNILTAWITVPPPLLDFSSS